MDNQNEIYKYLSSEGMTDLSERDFLSVYSNKEKAADIYNWFKENELTDVDFDKFYSSYLAPSDGDVPKKKVGTESSESLEETTTSEGNKLVSTPDQEILTQEESDRRDIAESTTTTETQDKPFQEKPKHTQDELDMFDRFTANPRLLTGASDNERQMYSQWVKDNTPDAKKITADKRKKIIDDLQGLDENQLFDFAQTNVQKYYDNLGGMTPVQKMDMFESRVQDLLSKYESISSSTSVGDIDKVVNEYNQEVKSIANEIGLSIDEEGTVKPFDAELQQYQDRLKNEISYAARMQDKPDSYTNDLFDKLAAGLNGWYASMVDLGGFLTGANYFSGYRELSEGQRFRAEQLREASNRYDKSIEEYVGDGDIGKAAGLAIMGAAESLPYMIPLLGNPAYGAYVMGAGVGMDKYREVEVMDIPQWKKIATSVVAGMSEMVFEEAFTVPILMQSKLALKNLGKQQGEKVIADAVGTTMKTSASKVGGGLPAWVNEGLSEVATGISTDISDKIYTNPELKIGNHAFDDFVVGAVMGKVFDAPNAMLKSINRAEQKKLVQDVIDRIPADMDFNTQLDVIALMTEREALLNIENKLADEFKGKNIRRITELNNQIQELTQPYFEKQYEEGREIEDDQTKLNYLRSRGVTIKDGTDMDTLNKMYQEEKAKEKADKQKIDKATGAEKAQVEAPIQKKSTVKGDITIETENAIMYGIAGKSVDIGDEVIELPYYGVVISDVSLKNQESKGKGFGQEIYTKALMDFGVIYSTFPTSEDAFRVQDTLEKKGLVEIDYIELDGVGFRVIKPTDKLVTEEKVSPKEEKLATEPRVEQLKTKQDGKEKVQERTEELGAKPTTEKTVEGSKEKSKADTKGEEEEITAYHGTTEDFTEFDETKMGKTDSGWFGKGFYFHTDQNRGGYGNIVKKVKLRLKNPLKLPVNYSGRFLYDTIGEAAGLDKSWRNESAMSIIKGIGSERFTELAKKLGYDGVVVENVQGTKEIVAFGKESIEIIPTDQPKTKIEPLSPEKGVITPPKVESPKKQPKKSEADYGEFVKDMISDEVNFNGVDVGGLSARQVTQAIRDIKRGKESVAAKTLKDAMREMYDTGQVRFKATQAIGQVAKAVPITDFRETVQRSEERQREIDDEYIERELKGQAEAIVKTAGIKPNNLRDVYKAGRDIFGLNRVQALAQAIITDRIIGKIAKNKRITKESVYSKLEYRKTTPEQLSKEAQNLYQAVWHGSPHEFDKFRLDKIGTGEGAQAFGWGLYFTDRKGIAEGYAKNLSQQEITLDGKNLLDVRELYGIFDYYDDFMRKINMWLKFPDGIKNVVYGEIEELTKFINTIRNRDIDSIVDKSISGTKRTIEANKRKLEDVKNKVKQMRSIPELANEADAYYERYGQILEDKIESSTEFISDREARLKEEQFKKDNDIRNAEEALKSLNYLSDNIDKIKLQNNRNLYKVKLHGDRAIDDFNYLRWDKPLTDEQKKIILDAIDNENIEITPFTNRKDLKTAIENSKNGVDVYGQLSRFAFSDKEASLFLLRAGIDGIKYPTEITRKGTHEESFNYVIFDENVAEIEEHIKFQKDRTVPQGAKGAMQTLANGNSIIHALTNPDVSTPLHEIAHVYEKYMTKAERDAVLRWTGEKQWTVNTSEKFARGFEKYLATGKAPKPSLQHVFDRFKTWLTDIYNGITGSEIDLQLNDEMVRVYNAMLGEGTVRVQKTEATTKRGQEYKDKFDDVDSLLFQDGVLFQGEDKTEKHTQAVNKLIDNYEKQERKDIAQAVRDYLAERGNPVSEEIVNNVLKQRGYAPEKQSSKVQKESPKESKGRGKSDSDMPKGNGAELQDRTEAEAKEKLRQLGVKVTESTKLRAEIKNLVKKYGVGYVPRGEKITDAEAYELIKIYESMGGLMAVREAILNRTNDISGDTRVAMANMYVQRMLDLSKSAKTPEQASKYNEEAAEMFSDFIHHSTDIAQELQAHSRWKKIIGAHPDFIGVTARQESRRRNKELFEKYKNDIGNSQQIISDYLNSDEFKAKYTSKRKPRESKKTRDQRVQEGVVQINNGLSKLDKLKGILFQGGELITGEAYDAVREIADGIVKIGVKSREDLMDKLKVQVRKYFTESEVNSVADKLAKDTDVENNITKRPSKVTIESTEEKKLVDKIYAKTKVLTKAQLRQLLADNVELFVKEGAIDDKSFQELFAKALGREYVGEKQIAKLKSAATKINDVTNIQDRVSDMYDAYKKEMETDNDKKKLSEMETEISKMMREYRRAVMKAGVAGQEISEVFADPSNTVKFLSTFIQGNLLTPASLFVNVVSNITWLPVRAAKNTVATLIDASLSSIEIGHRVMVGKELASRNPFWQKIIEGMINSERTFIGTGFNRGFAIGGAIGTKEGVKQMWYGQVSDDLYRRDLNKAIHPIHAWMRLYAMARGEEKARMADVVNSFIEGTIGVPPEIMFRLLNLGDKPFRRAAELSSLQQQAEAKKKQWVRNYLDNEADRLGLTGDKRTEFKKNIDKATQSKMDADWDYWVKRFMDLPDEESAEIARQAGLEATYQQDNIISDFINKLDKKKRSELEGTLGKLDSWLASLLRFMKVTQMPYVKTPTNIMLETFDYVMPQLSLVKGLWYTVNGNRRKAVDMFARSITGTFLNSAINLLFSTGIMSLASGGDDDDEVTQRVRASEYRNLPAYYINTTALNRLKRNLLFGENNSLMPKPGDNWSSYQRFGLVSSLLMTHGKAYKGMSLDEIKNMSWLDRSTLSVIPAIQSGLDQSFVVGISSAINAIQGSSYEMDSWLFNTGRALGASVLPNTVRSYNLARDNYIRETRDKAYSEWDRIPQRLKKDIRVALNKGQEYPTKITVWGERVERYQDGNSPLFRMFDITRNRSYKSDFGVKLFELYKRTQDNSVLLTPIDHNIRYLGQNVKLTPKMTESLQIYVGKNMKMQIEPIINSMEFASMLSDDERIEFVQGLYNGKNGVEFTRSELTKQWIEFHQSQIEKLFTTQHGHKAREDYYRRKER